MSFFKKTSLMPGDLDPAFGDGGLVTLAFPGVRDTYGECIAEGPDGRIYVGGAVGGEGDDLPTHSLGIACLDKAGALVTEFGKNGCAILKFAPMQDIHPRQIHFLTVGGEPRILLYGVDTIKNEAVIGRLHGDGRIDERFGIKGQITVKLPDNAMQSIGSDGPSVTTANSTSKACAVSNGKIYVAVELFTPVWQATVAVLIRLNINGSIDSSFNKVGYVAVTNTHFAHTKIHDILDSGGKITVCGKLQNNGMVARLNEDGSLDTGFAEGGFKLFDTATEIFTSITPFNDTGVAVAGWGLLPRRGVLSVLTDKGEFDTSFNGGKVLFASLDSELHVLFYNVAVVAGKIVVSGRKAVPDGQSAFLVARYNLNGTLDVDFGRGEGWSAVTFDKYFSVANSMAIQTDENILVVGDEFTSSDTALVVRFLNKINQ